MDAMKLALQLVADGVLEIDRAGQIWRVRDAGRVVARRRAESVGGKGYLRVVLGVPRERRTCSVAAHRLVWSAARGVIPEGLQINHRDLNKQNNCLDNLELVTGKENVAHANAAGHGSIARSWTKATTWRGRPRITAETAAAVRAERAAGAQYKDIAARHGISTGYAFDICHRDGAARAR